LSEESRAAQFEERLKKVIDEASEDPEGQILFID
jgi:ATP-dependent Clp protease ATP-binding subunit ClpA